MEKKDIHVLMVDDHKMTLVGYSAALQQMSEEVGSYTFTVHHATSFDMALQTLNHTYRNQPLHLVFLDIQLPKGLDLKYQTGEDLGIDIRKRFPDTKILVITTFNNNLLIQNVLESINPEGLLIKGDLTPDTFSQAILEVLDDPPYFSKTVTKYLRKQHIHPYHLDRLDRLILYYISDGKLTKNLPLYVPLSLPGIEKRKKRLKEIFIVEDGNDFDLVRRAKEEGFL
ncbi:response regulator [Ulvibacter litoralis]|uniref:DNA-binding response regulator, NarL/FixJ family, contains REC and HTH domains n=1 Tax=Ulvibacter litoralis TaxID=227084 RepID=A0A1G7JF62_9FLAO|nr:response regulator [Ulvibacter litoralis]GHC64982.1 DNA-binding response regulator [Ulvibacter litoralis]SDF23556.1 DNA-binding response regulator, NarL/FixJ family, contains REC and HTH domains [Ulvibacter litoralis]